MKFAIFLLFASSTFAQQVNNVQQVTVVVNDDSALAEKQRITAENGQQIGQAIGKSVSTAIQIGAAKHAINKFLKQVKQHCASHPGPDRGAIYNGGETFLGMSRFITCDDGIPTFHEAGFKNPFVGKTLTIAP
jgi:hypothetical protein